MLLNAIPKQEEVFIIGGGTSLKEVNLSLIEDKFVIGVNNAFSLGKWVNVCWFGDRHWYEWNQDRLKEYPGVLSTCHPEFRGQEGILYFERGKWTGIETDSQCVAWNRCSGGSAINFAYHLGAKKIILIAFDMERDSEGQNNWHNEHKAKIDFDIYNPYPGFLKAFRQIAVEAAPLQLKIIDTSLEGKLNCFPKVKLEDCI